MAPSKNLSTQQRTQIMQKLLSALNKKGKPVLGTINALATEFQVCRKTITRLWSEVKKQITNNNTVINLNSKKVGREAATKSNSMNKSLRPLNMKSRVLNIQ